MANRPAIAATDILCRKHEPGDMGMRKIAGVLLLAAAAAFPAQRSSMVTVAKLDQLLAAAQSKSDGKVAGELADLELSERANAAKLTTWQTQFTGNRTRQALVALGDASAFLEPPADEIPATAAPDIDAERAMLSKAADYVAKTMPTLPDFYASRETMHFEDSPAEYDERQSPGIQSFTQRGLRGGNTAPTGHYAAAKPIHFVDRSSIVVTYRDGLEVAAAPASRAGSAAAGTVGLTTSGEFGPILSIVLGDAERGDLRWGYWEEREPAAAAVFRYKVPQQQSHYTVMLPNAQQTVTLSPAYHGEIALDPATGTVLRMTVISDFDPPYQQLQINIMVEYAQVLIGERNYFCPARGIALSRVPIGASKDAKHPAPVQTFMNDVTFTHYHLFRAESKILQ